MKNLIDTRALSQSNVVQDLSGRVFVKKSGENPAYYFFVERDNDTTYYLFVVHWLKGGHSAGILRIIDRHGYSYNQVEWKYVKHPVEWKYVKHPEVGREGRWHSALSLEGMMYLLNSAVDVELLAENILEGASIEDPVAYLHENLKK